MLCYLTSIAYKMCIIPLMTGFALTCPSAHNVSAGRLWHCICQPLLQALFRGFHRGHVTQSETLRPAATHLQQGDAAVKHACQRKNNNNSNHDLYSQCIIAHYEYILSLQTAIFLSFIYCCLSNFMMMIIPKSQRQTWKCFTSVSLIKVIIHNEPEKCLWLCWCNSEVINSYLCFIWHT